MFSFVSLQCYIEITVHHRVPYIPAYKAHIFQIFACQVKGMSYLRDIEPWTSNLGLLGHEWNDEAMANNSMVIDISLICANRK